MDDVADKSAFRFFDYPASRIADLPANQDVQMNV